jgi:hypothetical protein
MISYPGCGLFYGLPFGVMGAEEGIFQVISEARLQLFVNIFSTLEWLLVVLGVSFSMLFVQWFCYHLDVPIILRSLYPEQGH